ncbi:MAG TPA: cytochrome c, partial [Opitutaceae bacterium]|nr:cytochrome c [Opitutaceae bacterium]
FHHRERYFQLRWHDPGSLFERQTCRWLEHWQPALVGSSAIAGEPARLIDLILRGPEAALPADRPRYANAMPPFAPVLNDAETAALVNFLRGRFAQGGASTTPAEVSAIRARR